MFDVSVSYVLRARQRRTRTGEVRALKARQVQVRRLSAHGDALRQKVAMQSDLTLAELCTWLRTERAVSVGTTALWRELRRLGLTLKKSQHAAEAARSAWRADRPRLKPGHLVFLDQSWASTNMTRRYGRNPRGQPCRAAIPHGHWKTSTLIAGLRSDGIVAPLVFEGAINAEIFRCYIGEMLAPTLLPGDVVVMNNLPAHKGAAIRALIEAHDATLL